MLMRAPHAGSGETPLLLGDSSLMRELRAEIERAGRSLAKVLILGETGVGKEVVARMVHATSARCGQWFVAVNCSGIPETLLASELFGHVRGSFTGAYRDKIGLVRQADHGTLFLDELGEMSLAMQAMLLRFTETGEIQPVGVDAPVGRTDVRLITATNRDLRARIGAGVFREDLYYRLNVIQINIPPLRERGLDVLLLCRYYLEQASETYRVPSPQLTPDAERLLLAHPWPGNVRELRNLTERLALRDTTRPVEAADVAPLIGGAASAPNAGVPMSERPNDAAQVVAQQLWERLREGGDFWTVVQQPFRAHQITKAELAALIDRGLQETRGSYRALVRLFNLPP